MPHRRRAAALDHAAALGETASLMSAITAHVLDISRGHPAMGLAVILHVQSGPEDWLELGRAQTDNDGRVKNLLAPGVAIHKGTYRLTFETGAYFQAAFAETFFPRVEVLFNVTDPAPHYHVPLLVTPFGYTTYRGT